VGNAPEFFEIDFTHRGRIWTAKRHIRTFNGSARGKIVISVRPVIPWDDEQSPATVKEFQLALRYFQRNKDKLYDAHMSKMRERSGQGHTYRDK
jgi:hypothetical protein